MSAKSIFNDANIPAPPLDIEQISSSDLHDPKLWVYNNNSYNRTYLEHNGSCQPTQVTSSRILDISAHATDSSQDYKWGFSFIQLNLTIFVMFILSAGLWLMHVSTTFEMRRRKQPPLVAGEFKAVLKLAERVSHEFDKLGEDTRDLSEARIRRRIRTGLGGGGVTYQAPLVEELQTGLSWRQEKMWMGGTLAVILVFSTSWFYNGAVCGLLIAPALGCVLATSIGTTMRSRVLMVLFCTTVEGIAIAAIASYAS